MESVARDFRQGAYRFQQVFRDGMLAIYKQTHREGSMVRYEVVRLRIAAEKTWPNGSVTPEREAYPGSSVWGKDGFTCFTLGEAQGMLARWKS